MFTVCPKCTLSLAVTAADLRAGQGYVRCGRCSKVFNALASLSDEQPAAAPAAPPPAPRAAAEDLEKTWEPEALGEESLEFTLGTEEIHKVLIETDPADPHSAAGIIENIVLQGEAQPEEPEPHHLPPPIEAANDAGLEEPVAADAPAEAPEEPSPASLQETPLLEQPLEEPPPEEPQQAGRRIAAIASAVLLALLLLGQWVHHRRDELASSTVLQPLLSAVYGAFGVPLAPRWDVRAYEVRQLGASGDVDAPGQIVVRASVRNRASRPQPLPVLRLRLHDRFGALVAARDVQPGEYLRGTAAERFLAPDQRIDTEIALIDPGKDAVGFELDACLPLSAAAVRCASDAGPPAS